MRCLLFYVQTTACVVFFAKRLLSKVRVVLVLLLNPTVTQNLNHNQNSTITFKMQ